jgi:N4-gp56 family major capsid protein
MATTSFAVNDAYAVKLWAKELAVETLKYTMIAPLIGTDAGSVIHKKEETEKGKGDQVTFGLRLQLLQDGFTENELAEGNGESLTIFTDQLTINELLGVVGVKSDRTIDQQRVPFDLRAEARDGLADWWAKRLSVSFFNQVCGNVAETRTKYTGLQAVTAPSTGRQLWQGGVTADEGLASSNTMTLGMIDKGKELAITLSPPIRPINAKGKSDIGDYYDSLQQGKYVCYLHPYQVTDLRTNTSTGQWLDIEKAAATGGLVKDNPIYVGALGEYNGVILKSSFDVTTGCNSSTGAQLVNVRRAVLLGAQAAVIGYGTKHAGGKYQWNEELFDHKRRLEVSALGVWGIKKTRFNAIDYGVIPLSTWAVAHQ